MTRTTFWFWCSIKLLDWGWGGVTFYPYTKRGGKGFIHSERGQQRFKDRQLLIARIM